MEIKVWREKLKLQPFFVNILVPRTNDNGIYSRVVLKIRFYAIFHLYMFHWNSFSISSRNLCTAKWAIPDTSSTKLIPSELITFVPSQASTTCCWFCLCRRLYRASAIRGCHTLIISNLPISTDYDLRDTSKLHKTLNNSRIRSFFNGTYRHEKELRISATFWDYMFH